MALEARVVDDVAKGFPANLAGWKKVYGPQVTERLLAEEVDCVLLTTA